MIMNSMGSWVVGFLTFWLAGIRLTDQTILEICMQSNVYQYDLNQCPGGIQLRDQNRWMSKNRPRACICGNGSILQFDGEDTQHYPDIYPIGFPSDLLPFMGSFHAYKLENGECELLQGNQVSALFIDLKYFEDPDNFPHRPLELLVSATEHMRLSGSYRIGIFNGHYSRDTLEVHDNLKTVMFNIRDPVIIVPDPIKKKSRRLCAHSTEPEVIVSKYISSYWFQQGEEASENCGSKSYPKFQRTRGICRSSCTNKTQPTGTGVASQSNEKESPARQFQKIFETLGEVSLRLKFANKDITFGENEPHVALLQKSCRVFFRGFPNVVKWQTLMHAVTIFGIAFEGLVPSKLDKDAYNRIRVALDRCATEQKKNLEENDAIFRKICAKAGNGDGSGGGGGGDFKGYNVLIELLWMIVQFVQARCLPSTDHHPNVHHFYASAMIEMFSSPTVQLLWHQKPETQDAMNRAMLHVIPELPDHALGTIQEILKQIDYQIYFSILKRPKIQKLEERDMRCAGHGKIIWGGKACCYLEEDDKKFYFYNRVAFAKL